MEGTKIEMTDLLDGFKNYLYSEKKVSQNTLQSYLRDAEYYFAFLSDRPMNNPLLADQETVELYVASLEKLGRSSSTISRNIASIRCFYQYLILENRIPANPVEKIKRKKEIKKYPDILTREEIDLLLSQPDTKELKGCRDKAMMELLYATGIRVSELIDLDVSDMNLRLGVLHCRGSHSDRAIPIYPTAVTSVSDYISRVRCVITEEDGEDKEALFVNLNGHRLTRQGFWKIIKDYAEQAKISKDITPYTLRHSFALHLLENGAELKDIQEMLGHSDISSTQVYVRILNDRFKEVYNNCHPRAKKAQGSRK